MDESDAFERRRAQIKLFAQRWRFSLLLALLTLGLLLQAGVGAAAGGVLAVDILFGGLVLATAVASEARRGVIALLAALSLARIGIATATDGDAMALAQATSVAAAVAIALLTLGIVLTALFRRAASGADALAGAAFGFLLLGLAFALVFIAVEIAQPGAFRLIEDGGPMAAQLIYYSLVTLTTTGYGDIVAVTPLMRLVSALEGAIGDLYLAVLIGRLLGVAFQRRAKF